MRPTSSCTGTSTTSRAIRRRRDEATYRNSVGELVVEDVKSAVTRKNKDYVIKRKLMLREHGITIQEVE
ncbi:hypothetical protein AQ714_22030 [Burkholderia pseudomallei]|nr:hypothetical protein AQ714_22030 [Burkholderia pseudomallei]